MSWTDSTLLVALQFLVPGFITASVLSSLTADRQFSDLQRLVQALIFSVIVKLVVTLVAWVLNSLSQFVIIGIWTPTIELGWSVVLGALFGVLWAIIVNHDKLYSWLRDWGITTQTARPSVWYSCFSDNPETYAVLQLSDGRRLQGWVSEWPSVADAGHIKLDRAAWLAVDEEYKQTSVNLPPESFIMVRSSDVRWVEFQPRPTAVVDEEKQNTERVADEK